MLMNPGPNFDPREEMPGRIAHRRRVAENLNAAARELPPGSPGREIRRPGGAHHASGPGALIPDGALQRGPVS